MVFYVTEMERQCTFLMKTFKIRGRSGIEPTRFFLMAPFYFLALQWYLRSNWVLLPPPSIGNMKCHLLLSKLLSTLPGDRAWWLILFCRVWGSPYLNSPKGRKLSMGE